MNDRVASISFKIQEKKNMNLWLIFAVIHTCSKGSKIDADELMGWYKRHSDKGKYMDYSPFVQPLRPTRTQEAHGYFPVWRKAHAAPVGIAYDQNPYPGDRDRLRFPLVTRTPPPPRALNNTFSTNKCCWISYISEAPSRLDLVYKISIEYALGQQ